MQIIKVKPGDPWSDDLPEILEQRLRQAGIFNNEISVEHKIENEKVFLSISITDKWTLIPAPLYMNSQGVSSLGGFIGDFNLFGIHHFAVISAIFSFDGKETLFGMYSIPHLGDTSFSLTTFAKFKHDEKTLGDFMGEEEFGSYEYTIFDIYELLRYSVNDQISIGGEIGYRQRTINNESSLSLPEAFSNSMTIGGSLEFNSLYLYPLFSKGVQFSFNNDMAFYNERPSLTTQGQIMASAVPFEWIQLQLFATFYNTNGALPEQMSLGSGRGHKTLFDNRIVSANLLAGEASVEFRLFTLPIGYITMPLFLEAGVFSEWNGEAAFFYGIGGGIRFYMKKVAIPAIGLEVHCCLNDNNPVNIAFSVGMSF